MYAEPFVCDYDSTVASGSTPQTFAVISFPTGRSSLRKNNAADTGALPEVMKVSHEVVGKGAGARDRHMIRFEVSSTDTDDNVGTTTPAVAYAVFDIPRLNCLTNTPTILARMLTGFLRGANADDGTPDYTTNLAKLLNGEI